MKTPAVLAPLLILTGFLAGTSLALAQRAPAPAPPPAAAPPPTPAPAPPTPPPAPAAAAPAPAPTPPPAPALSNAQGFGQPLPGLSTSEQADFNAGQATFAQVETPATGLGAIFNNVSCLACHATPTAGGVSAVTVTRFGRNNAGVFDPLTELDGTLLHARAIAPVLLETVPAQANVTTKRLTTPLYGGGLIEAIPDETIILNSQTPKFAGVQGSVAVVTDAATGLLRVGRFGWKAQHATLLSFSGDAFNNEMGITNRIFPTAHAPDGNTALLSQFVSLTAGPEDVVDPTTGKGDIDRAADYLRYLAPPAPAPSTPQSLAGAQIFTLVGCASCHTPAMKTGPNASAALNNQTVALYSDLILHDMGALGDGIAQGAAATTEMRTAPLWGLRTRTLYLHDGRATSLDAAIRAHAGEAQASTAAYAQLTPTAQQQLLAFLNTL
jgi:CxxC motif-containing protein (DUF1111 family)